MSDRIAFAVRGIPVPQGSKRAYVVNGKPILTEEAGPRHKTWRSDIKARAEQEWFAAPTEGACLVRLIFRFPRPLSHFGTGKNRDVLKATAPVDHTQKPDIDKLTRAVLDALTGIIWKDDDQVCQLVVTKEWCGVDDRPGLEAWIDVRS